MIDGKKGGKMDGKTGRAGAMKKKKHGGLPHGRPKGGGTGKTKGGEMKGGEMEGEGGGMKMAKAWLQAVPW